MTPEQFGAILEAIRSGSPVDVAARSCGVSPSSFAAEIDAHDGLAAIVDDAVAFARVKQRRERTYSDDPDPFREPDASNDPPPTPCTDEGFQSAIDSAAEMGPGLVGQLAWVEKRCALVKRHPIDEVWLHNYNRFFEGKWLILGILAGLRAGKTTSSLRAILPGALFGKHKVEAGEIAGIPIMSASTKLATMNLNEVEITLQACGMAPSRRGAEGFAVMPGGVGGTYRLTNSSSGGGVIEFINAHGAKVRVMCMAANVASAVGYTAIGAFLDETEVWRNAKTAANPATEVIDAVQQRATTTFETAKIIVSSSYYPDIAARRKAAAKGTDHRGAHQQLIEAGDTETTYIAKLGEVGAQRDNEARWTLARKIGSNDPRLLSAADPNSPSIPAWAARQDLDIYTLYLQRRGDISSLLSLYGGRMECVDDSDTTRASLYEAYAAANRRICGEPSARELIRFDGLSSLDPRSRGYGSTGGSFTM